MWVNTADSVSEALHNGLHALRVRGIKQPSRVGDVLVSPHPVMTVYRNPLNRVLFSPLRDANPFFHVMESLWMLAGRNDLPWLTQFNKQMASYSDDGGQTQPGAYGYRWRNHFQEDQLDEIIVELKKNPQSRRCVLAMWDPVGAFEGDHRQWPGDLVAGIMGSADVPCNTHAYFDTIDGRLNMTVCNRSNDIWWGAHGANAVHFSFLLEYMAAATGLPMGVYRQFSNNYHVYTNVVAEDTLMPMTRNILDTDKYYQQKGPVREPLQFDLRRIGLLEGLTLDEFHSALWSFMTNPDATHAGAGAGNFFSAVAYPMRTAWEAHKAKAYNDAIHIAEMIRAEDWKIACVEWLQRRKIKHERNAVPFTEQVATNTFNEDTTDANN